MTRFRSLFIAIFAILFLIPSPVFAQPHHTPGDIAIAVVDQDENPIQGIWFLHEGSGEEGMIIRNGTFGEVFKMNYGTYFLRGQNMRGYESFEVIDENPQDIIPHGIITFTLKYYVEGYAAAQSLSGAVQQEEVGAVPVVPAEAAQVEELAQGDVAAETIETLPTETQVEEEEITVVAPAAAAPVVRELEISPLRVPAPDRLSHTGEPEGVKLPMQLAVTGPGGLLMMLIGSGLAGLWAMRRKLI